MGERRFDIYQISSRSCVGYLLRGCVGLMLSNAMRVRIQNSKF
jgi:hypothetical protein